MRRLVVISLLSMLLLVVAGAGMVLYLLNDEAFLKNRLHAFMLDYAGRELRIDGGLDLDLGRRTSVQAMDIHLANADWAARPEMASVGRLRVDLDLFSLFGDTPVLPRIELEDCRIELVENDRGETNWAAFAGPVRPAEAEPVRPEGLPVMLLDNRVADCVLVHEAPGRERPLRLELDRFELRLLDDRRWQVDGAGRVNDDPVSLSGWMGPSGAILRGEPAEHELELQVGQVRLHSKGHFDNAATGAGADLAMNFSGPELGRVLAHLNVPPVSEGPFDFRLSLADQGAMTRVQVRGDLGRMQADAEGSLDRLVKPTRGSLRASVQGPNLEALGRAFGLRGALTEAYSLRTAMSFETGSVRIDSLNLETAGNSLVARGVLGTGSGLAGTDLALTVQCPELGRWAGLWRRPPGALGPFTLDGGIASDASGLFTFTGKARLGVNSLTLTGPLGFVSGPLQSDVNFDLRAERPEVLEALTGYEHIPDAPLSARGRVGFAADRLRLGDVRLDIGVHSARLDGSVNTVAPYTGTQLAIQLDSPAAADLGRLFGLQRLPAAPLNASGELSRPDRRLLLQNVILDLDGHRLELDGSLLPAEAHWTVDALDARLVSPDVSGLAGLFDIADLPHEPANIAVTVDRDGAGARFSARQAGDSELHLAATGTIPDLAKPLLLDAEFDIRLPRLSLLSFLKPDFDWPELPAAASGKVRTHGDRASFEEITGRLGNLRVDIAGEARGDNSYDLVLALAGDDASALTARYDFPVPPEAFSLRTRVLGKPGELEFADVEAMLGQSRAEGMVRLEFGETNRLSARLHSPFIDFSPWIAEVSGQNDEDADFEQASGFVFDDTPVLRVADLGWAFDVGLTIDKAAVGNGEFEQFEVGLRLAGQRLEIEPFALTGSGGGQSSGRGILDTSADPPRLDVELHSKGLRIGIASSPTQDPSTIPATDVDLELQGTGRTHREMASSIDGRLRVFSGEGLVASSGLEFFLSDFLTELVEALNPFSEHQDTTQLDCAVAAADIEDGVMEVRPVVFNTREITILSEGTIDLRSERINLSFNSKPRTGLGISTGVLINPLIKIGGSLGQPAIELDPARAIVSGGTAVATAGLSVVAKSFFDRFLSSKDPCGEARAAIEKREQG